MKPAAYFDMVCLRSSPSLSQTNDVKFTTSWWIAGFLLGPTHKTYALPNSANCPPVDVWTATSSTNGLYTSTVSSAGIEVTVGNAESAEQPGALASQQGYIISTYVLRGTELLPVNDKRL
jgi:hypothetical protein